MRTRHPYGSKQQARLVVESKPRLLARESPRKSSVPGAAHLKHIARGLIGMVLSQSAYRSTQAAELPLHEQALRREGHLIAQNVETGARQLVSERLDGEQRIALAALAFVEAPRGRQVADGKVCRLHERPSEIGIAVLA